MVGLAELLIILVLLLGIGFWGWMLVECLTKEPAFGNTRLTWLLVILLAGWIGALLYFLIQRPKRRARQLPSGSAPSALPEAPDRHE